LLYNDLVKQEASYVFSNCKGPYGLVHITGTVTVTIRALPAGEKLVFDKWYATVPRLTRSLSKYCRTPI
jgi:hypothetical protein